MSSFGLFENAAQSDEATKLAAEWVREEKLEAALPNSPKITSGNVIARRDGAVAVA